MIDGEVGLPVQRLNGVDTRTCRRSAGGLAGEVPGPTTGSALAATRVRGRGSTWVPDWPSP